MAAIVWDTGAARQPRRQAPARSLHVVTIPQARRRPGAAVYRRRRLVALVVLLVALTLAAQTAGALLSSSASAGVAPATPEVLVAEAGDSYWTLAAEVHDGGDIRSTVDRLVAANGGRDLRPGDRIVLR